MSLKGAPRQGQERGPQGPLARLPLPPPVQHSAGPERTNFYSIAEEQFLIELPLETNKQTDPVLSGKKNFKWYGKHVRMFTENFWSIRPTIKKLSRKRSRGAKSTLPPRHK